MLRPWNLTIQLQRQNGKGLHLQITQAIIEEIRRSRLILGMPMPGSRELAEKLGVNRKTVVLAYEELVAQGWLQAQGRRGTFVAAEFPVTEKGVKPDKSNVRESTENSNELFLEERLDSGLQARPEVINFTDGTPDSRLIPYTALSRAFRHAIIQSSRTNQLGYGDPRGSLILRQSLARMLKMERGLSSNEENICLVRGSQMGIYIAASVLVSAGDYVAFETLSYAQARNAFRSFGANIVSVAQDKYGLIPEDLERLCCKHRIRAVYVTPHHQYPTTVMMPAERRLRLLALAETFDFTIVEDDYDHDFHFDHRPTFPMARVDRAGKVIYIGSMSKVLAPGLRLGYISAKPEIIKRCATKVMQIDRQGNSITELAVHELMASGELKRHLRSALKVYAQRRDAAVQTIRRNLSRWVEFEVPAGGLALWLRMANGLDAHLITTNALVNGVRLVSSSQYSDTGECGFGLRLGYGSMDETTFEQGIDRLRAVFSSLT